MWDKLRYFLDYLTCEIMFISDVHSPLDDSVIFFAFELNLLICLPIVFSLALYLKVRSSRICAVLLVSFALMII